MVKTHAALGQGRRTGRGDYPPEKIAFQTKTPLWCRTQASEVQDRCREVVGQLLEANVLYRLRATEGILGLRALGHLAVRQGANVRFAKTA
ncbi:hypothetical protein [Streptomyces sp. NPDC051452]|uniref:hypothetical protein n=1 Tax=Streptomyces sp. NPDC051452 TaxID=3365654 RepID=UPI00379AF190